MGDNFGDGEAREGPVHTVDLDAFYISKYEVTNAQWKAFREDPGYDNPQFWPNGIVMPKDQIPYWTQPNNHGGALPGHDNYPVLGVNWDAAVAYCNWLSAKTGKKYRLPTEAEWEKAARGTDQRKYPWGNDIDATKPTSFRTLTSSPPSLSAPTNSLALRRLRHGRQRHGVVQRLVRQGLLQGLPAQESPRPLDRCLPRCSRRHLLHGAPGPAHLPARRRLAQHPNAPHDQLPPGPRAIVAKPAQR